MSVLHQPANVRYAGTTRKGDEGVTVALTLQVLGAVEARRADDPVDLGHLQQRGVLAALLVDAEATVTAEQLVDRLWGDHVPARARHALYSYLSRLRRALAPEAEIIRQAGGYVLSLDKDAVDMHRFRRLTRQAESTADAEAALELVEQAVGLWRGVAFAGLDTTWFSSVRNRLETEKFAAQLYRNDLALGLGRHAELLAELQEEAAEHPLDERLAGQLMLALYRSGKQAEALEQFRQIRGQLADGLGTDPSFDLQRLHQQILTAEPALALPETSHASTTPVSSPRPRQLPAPPALFVGRADELAKLDKTLDTNTDGTTITAISGTGGVGKTWLALRWAHDNAERFPDGQLYVDLRGFDPGASPLAPAEVIRQFLEAFELPPERIPASLDAQAARYRSLLASRRMLVVLDNARNTEQVVPLLPGNASCHVLVTSRGQLSGLVARHNATPVFLDALSEHEAISMLANRLGHDRVADEPTAVAELVDYCARLPLALGIATARATAKPEFTLHALAEELRDERERLDVLGTDEPASDVRAVFSWSYQVLSAPAARLFRLLGLFPGQDITLHPAASLAGLELPATRSVLAELTRTHLLDEHAPGRYSFHDLLRVYAAERAAEEDAQVRNAAIHRVLDHYLHTGFAAERHLAPHWEPITLDAPQPHVAVRGISDYAQALLWFAAERANVVAAVELAERTGFDVHAWQLPWALSTYLNRRGFWHLRVATQRIGLAAADRLGDGNAQAIGYHLLARGYAMLDQFEASIDTLRTTLRRYEKLGDRTGQATTHFTFTQLYLLLERPAEALEHSRTALELYRATGNRVWEAFSLSAVGGCEALLGRYRQSLADSTEALALLRTLGNLDGQAHTLRSLGYTHHELDEHAKAAGYLHEAAVLFGELSDSFHEANTLRLLGDAHEAAGEPERAKAAWERAVHIFDELDHSDADAVRTKLRAHR